MRTLQKRQWAIFPSPGWRCNVYKKLLVNTKPITNTSWRPSSQLPCRGMWASSSRGISRLIILAIKISSCVQMLSVPVRKCSGSLEKFCKKSGEKPREKDQFGDSVEQTGARHPAMCCWCSCRTTLELETDICKDWTFTITEKAPAKAFSSPGWNQLYSNVDLKWN